MRLLDVVVAIAGLVLLVPLAALASLLIVVETRGGALYAARRMGRGGLPFTMWKLRTMRLTRLTSGGGGGGGDDDDGDGGGAVTTSDDVRVTRIGRALRGTRFDEWPQLWNVLRGEMSLVGPRPEDPSFVDLADPRWQRALSVRPGLTGPTQLAFAPREAIVLRGTGAVATYRREILPLKLDSDVRYADERSVVGDLRVLARTLLAPFRHAA